MRGLAVGLDLAARAQNWGVAVVEVDHDGGRLVTLLPELRRTSRGTRVVTRPTAEHVVAELTRLAESGLPVSIGVDVPFGWPEGARRLLAGNRADRTVAPASPRGEYELRLTDHCFARDGGKRPLSVSADKLGLAAHRWTRLRADLDAALGGAWSVDLGLEGPPASGVVAFETYPGGYLGGRAKPTPERRRELVADWARSGWRELEGASVEATLAKRRDAHGFDALVCARIAARHLRERRGEEPQDGWTTPRRLLGRAPTAEEQETIRREGWILVPPRPK